LDTLTHSFEFALLANIELWRNLNPKDDPWLTYNTATFVKRQTAEDIFEVNRNLEKQLPVSAQKRNEEIEGSFVFFPLSTLALETHHIRNDISQGQGNPSGRLAFAIIGLLLLTIARLNYINTATAQGARCIKEIGIRKVIGGKKSSIMLQFLIENMVLNSMALIIRRKIYAWYCLQQPHTHQCFIPYTLCRFLNDYFRSNHLCINL